MRVKPFTYLSNSRPVMTALNSEQGTIALDIPVRFVETDMMGVVHHSNYLVWFEAARVAWMDAAGMPYVEVAAGGNHFAVTGVAVEYRAAARFGDTVRVIVGLSQLRSRQVTFTYTAQNALDGTLLSTGHTEHICVDLAGRMAKIPQSVVDRLSAGVLRLKQQNRTPAVVGE